MTREGSRSWISDAGIMAMLAGLIRSEILRRPPQRGWRGLPVLFLSYAEKLLLQWSDPLVRWKLCEFDITLPLSHRLPFFLRAYPNYSMNLGRIAKRIERKYADLCVIDVGANIGDSVAILRAFTQAPVLCIEGNRRYLELLRTNTEQFIDVAIVESFLGEHSRIVNAAVQAGGGTGSLNGEGGTDRTVRLESLTDLLSKHPRFASARLLKIDTDGYDGKILRGARDFLATQSPIVFFEYDPTLLAAQKDNGVRIFGMLQELGYRYCLAYSNTGLLLHSFDCTDAWAAVELTQRVIENERCAYLDVCAFHANDGDLFESLCESEESLFPRSIRSDTGSPSPTVKSRRC